MHIHFYYVNVFFCKHASKLIVSSLIYIETFVRVKSSRFIVDITTRMIRMPLHYFGLKFNFRYSPWSVFTIGNDEKFKGIYSHCTGYLISATFIHCKYFRLAHVYKSKMDTIGNMHCILNEITAQLICTHSTL